MINAVDLFLVEDLFDLLIQRTGGFVIVAERLFDDHAAPRAVLLLAEARRAEVLNDHGKEGRRGRQVVQVIPLGSVRLIDLTQHLLEFLIRLRFSEFAGDIIELVPNGLPACGIYGRRGELLNILADLFAKLLMAHRRKADAHHCR